MYRVTVVCNNCTIIFFFKQKTAYEMRISDWSSDVCSSDLILIPLVKAHATDIGCEVASLGVQVHGGMGFIEETGAAQHYRDAHKIGRASCRERVCQYV